MRRKMNTDRWRASHEGIGQLPDGQLPPGKSFRGGKTTSVFEFVPGEDRQSFARRHRRALSFLVKENRHIANGKSRPVSKKTDVHHRQLRWRMCLRQGSFFQYLGGLAMLPTK